ncbi:hypothetical protein DEU56DRAFT_466684 [Suillus clintonianus]|uniref:uncharacterized protein n=1 Tax=Suillus clintonianus TaxID=1904413 RepID=UPI001B85E597|nr:uncharacterized protein DEU56DRAFT_466684 [Suillus clintonianus]KAG2130334.1 hypothetical protein DEU56DRAFT_466684 [Suillus clintonianus]
MSNSLRLGDPEREIYCHAVALKYPHRDQTAQRYFNTDLGACLPLQVQAVRPNKHNKDFEEVAIVSHVSKPRIISVWLMNNKTPRTTSEFCKWFLRWLQLCIVNPKFYNDPGFAEKYEPYLPAFVGQLWAARSPKEFSLLSAPASRDMDKLSMTHTIHPRKLVVRQEGGSWVLRDDKENLKRRPYFTISFRWTDVFRETDPEDVQSTKKRQFYRYIEETVGQPEEVVGQSQQAVSLFSWCSSQPAYWVDLLCSSVQNSREYGEGVADGYPADLYRMSDIYRNARFTLILLPDIPGDTRSIEERWEEWGSRVWTFPEACLSRELWCKVGNGPLTRLSLQELAKLAFKQPEDEAALLNAYDLHKDPLERLARLDHLKKAIWRRNHGGAPQSIHWQVQEHDDPDSCDCRNHGVLQMPAQNTKAKPAERVYALMGFFEHRILPQETESETQALARLSMANDSDRIAERMVSMLPKCMSESWYVDNDAYGAHLWDIATDIQIAGITGSGALVLEGCRAATIHWTDFPRLRFLMGPPNKRMQEFWSITRVICFATSSLGFISCISFLIQYFTDGYGDVTNLSIILPIFLSPLLLLILSVPLSHTSDLFPPIRRVEPWLIGVKGVLSADDVSKYLYGGQIKGPHSMRYATSGSHFSKPKPSSRFRVGDPAQFTIADRKAPHIDGKGDMYTLVETLSSTIYYFRARRPPTVCLFTGREGGRGRFVLCSESCELNELQKETVLRMPTFISEAMYLSDWVALGCREDALGSHRDATGFEEGIAAPEGETYYQESTSLLLSRLSDK